MKRRWLFSIVLMPILLGILHQTGHIDRKETPTAPAATSVSCERIVSLAPSITESLFAVGLGENVVGVTRYCAYPEVVAKIEKVGGYVDPNLSAIVALDPTLVMMLTEHEEIKKKLETLGFQTLSVSQHRVEDILGTLSLLGKTCNATSQSNRLVSGLQQRVARIATAVEGQSRQRVMISMGRNMGAGGLKDAHIAGEQSYYQDLITLAGGQNAYSGKVPFPIVSKEGMLGLNPDVIIDMVPDLKEKGWSEETIRQEWQALPVKAVSENRIHIFMAAHTVVPGPRFILTLEKIAQALHPEIEWKTL